MNVDDTAFLEWAFKGMVSITLTVFGWFQIMLVKSVVRNRDDLTAHKLHVSEHYARKSDLEPLYDYLDEIRNDIKELLVRKGK